MQKLKPLLFGLFIISSLQACREDVDRVVQLSIFNQTPYTLQCAFTTVDQPPSGHKLNATIEPGQYEQIYATPQLTDYPEELIKEVYRSISITVNDTLTLEFRQGLQGDTAVNYLLSPFLDHSAWILDEREESRPTNMGSDQLYIYDYRFVIKESLIQK